jgi:hypothetical protein
MRTIVLLLAAWAGFLAGFAIGAWWAALRRVVP